MLSIPAALVISSFFIILMTFSSDTGLRGGVWSDVYGSKKIAKLDFYRKLDSFF